MTFPNVALRSVTQGAHMLRAISAIVATVASCLAGAVVGAAPASADPCLSADGTGACPSPGPLGPIPVTGPVDLPVRLTVPGAPTDPLALTARTTVCVDLACV